MGVAKMRLKDKGASYRRHARTAGNKSKTTHGPTLRGNWPEGEREKKKKTPPTSHQRKGATGHHSQREGGTPLPLSQPHIPPPAARPCRFHRWGEEMPTNRAKDRADAQRLVATRLLDRLHDPLGHFGRLQRIYPRAW